MNDTLHFVHISDTHINPDPNYVSKYGSYSSIVGARALVDQINSLPVAPDFVLHTGDVVYDPYPEAYETAREVLSKLRYPVYYLAGNHDEGAALQRGLLGRKDGEVADRLHYEFEVKGVQFVCVDSNGPAEPPRGYVTEDQLAWLEGICAAEDPRPLVVAVHHNVPKVATPWLDEYMGVVNGEA